MISVKKKQNLSVVASNERHSLVLDVVEKLGGNDEGFDPHEALEASLGACTNITVMMYAHRKKWPLDDIHTVVTITKEGEENIIRRDVQFFGDLDDEQRTKLLEIANKCPIHRFLERKTTVETVLL